MPAPVDEVTHAIKTFNKALDSVLRFEPGPKRWRAANDLWLTLSFKNRQVYKEVCAENKRVRDAVNKFGFAKGSEKTAVSNSDHTLREALNIPAGAYMFIAKSDPTAFLHRENSQKMFNEFKEYTTREAW